VIATSLLQCAQQQESRQSREVILNISDDQKIQYLNQDFYSNAYNYGYEISPNGQFHHELRGPDDITYGCYGYIDPFGKLKTTFCWGYRVIQPGNSVELFLHEHEHHHEHDSEQHQHEHDDHHDHHGVITEWANLYFPEICRQFDGTGSGSSVMPVPGE
ncbi:hypothetical protein WN51_03200, partial [Melipona quadrifasciata]